MVIMETPPLETISPTLFTPLPLSEMSWPIDCGFIDRITTGPASAVADVLTNAKPLLATSISTTCPSAAPDTAEDAAEETAEVITEEAPDGSVGPEDEP